MGHKVNPKIFRIGLSESWNSRWFARGKDYAQYLKQDTEIRKYLTNKLKDAGVERIEIERSPDNINIIINSSRPGIIIGRGGAGIEEIKKYIEKKIISARGGFLPETDASLDYASDEGVSSRQTSNWNKKIKLQINIKEVSKPQLSAQLVAQNIAQELEKRIPYRRAMKRNIESVMKAGAQGVKVICSGRLDGVEIARQETLSQGKIPLHTLRADIDYGIATACTTYGTVGVKVWIYKGEVFHDTAK